MVEMDTLFKTQTAKKNIPYGAAHTYVADCESRCLRKRY